MWRTRSKRTHRVRSVSECMETYAALREAAKASTDAEERKRLLAYAQLWRDAAYALGQAVGGAVSARRGNGETIH